VISDLIDIPVLPISASPFSEDMETPTLEQLREYFHAHPQGHERTHAHIKIGTFSPPHRLLTKIVLHNFWPTVCNNELILKRAQFLYALVMRLPFCLCKHILSIMLESRDERTHYWASFCVLDHEAHCSVWIDVSAKLVMWIQDPLGSQTLMKSNAQLRFEGHDEAPQPPPVQVEIPTGASSSQTAPSPQLLAALSTMQGDISSIQREVRFISTQVEQC
jgi:hypothetical protein